jgi:hypothetical protein
MTFPDDLWARAWLAMAYSELNRQQEAEAEAAHIMRINPHFSIEEIKKRRPFTDKAVAERVYADLRKAGMK